ncbi:MAG TPA: hypothetical protein PKC42_04355 [Candidatus Nanoperiomorbaceae bacterium]|nr:hypothetical protein [Candidatus Nanoperiomorbaceae bacterium]
MSLLQQIVGKEVTGVSDDVAVYVPLDSPEVYPDSGSLTLTRIVRLDQYELQISNPFELKVEGEKSNTDLSHLIGKLVKAVEDGAESAIITFSDGSTLTVDLREESYVGPEAMILTGPNDLFVVWN